MPAPTELFLSHADPDREFAEELGRMLAAHGVPFWYSRRHLRGAQEWHDEIGEALARCDWFLVVLSPASVGSLWVKRELVYALQEARYAGRIVPLLLQPCDTRKLSWTLPAIQTVDFTTGFEKASRELLNVWGLNYQSG